jgi:sialate O-acetylesterase
MLPSRRTVVIVSLVFLVAAWLPPLPVGADVKLPAVVGPNMVLQRDISVPIWGWADSGEDVTVTFAGQTKATKAAADGLWMVRLDPLKAGGPHALTVAGKNTVKLENVLVGEVWLCSGQSNMGMTVARSNDAEEEIAAAKYPSIRLFSVPLLGTQEPQYDCKGAWAECSPETVGNFTAVGYFFGREIHQEIDVPVGLINCSWGGSSCGAWIKRSVLEVDSRYQSMLKSWDDRCAKYDPEKVQAAYQKQLEKWKAQSEKAKAQGKEQPRRPRAPRDPRAGQHRPANLYNGMLLSVRPFALRGTIWYQGESNAGRAYQYRHLFPTMINSWRLDWQQGDFPFYFVQLANFMATKPEPGDSAWAELREAQSMTLETPNTGQAVIIDIGDADDIHPKNKQDVGKRLALWALAKDYGRDIVYYGPEYKSMAVKGNKILIEFDHLGGGLLAKGGGPLEGFAIAGEDKAFVWADARIVGHSIEVSSPKIAKPAAVRYAWADNPACNLYNKEGIPASPFRTDQWPGITVDNK